VLDGGREKNHQALNVSSIKFMIPYLLLNTSKMIKGIWCFIPDPVKATHSFKNFQILIFSFIEVPYISSDDFQYLKIFIMTLYTYLLMAFNIIKQSLVVYTELKFMLKGLSSV